MFLCQTDAFAAILRSFNNVVFLFGHLQVLEVRENTLSKRLDFPAEVTLIRLLLKSSTDCKCKLIAANIALVGHIVHNDTRVKLQPEAIWPILVCWQDAIITGIVDFFVAVDFDGGPVETFVSRVHFRSILDKTLVKVAKKGPEEHSFIFVLACDQVM